MKTPFTFAVMSLMALTSFANAAEIPQAASDVNASSTNERRLYEFNFTCSFDHSTPAPASVNSEVNEHEIHAFAKVFAFADHGDLTKALELDRNYSNKLAVVKGDELTYANAAALESKCKFVKIKGLDGETSIRIKREDHSAITPLLMKYKATVRTEGYSAEGDCYVQAEPAHHSDDAPVIQ